MSCLVFVVQIGIKLIEKFLIIRATEHFDIRLKLKLSAARRCTLLSIQVSRAATCLLLNLASISLRNGIRAPRRDLCRMMT